MTETGSGTSQNGPKDELRACFLFESLTDGQLDWLVAHGTIETHEAGREVYAQGASAEYFYVLLNGEVQLVTRVDGADVVLNTASRPGAYAGATHAFISAVRRPVVLVHPAHSGALETFQVTGRGLCLPLEDLVPHGRPPPGRVVPRHDQHRGARRPKGEVDRPRVPLCRARPRAQQPGRGRGAGGGHAQHAAPGRSPRC